MVEQVQGHWAAMTAGAERVWRAAVALWHRIARAVPILGRAGSFTFEVLGKYHKDDCLSYAAGLSFWLRIVRGAGAAGTSARPGRARCR